MSGGKSFRIWIDWKLISIGFYMLWSIGNLKLGDWSTALLSVVRNFWELISLPAGDSKLEFQFSSLFSYLSLKFVSIKRSDNRFKPDMSDESGSEGCMGGEEEEIDVKPILIEWTTSPCSSSGGSENHDSLRCSRGGHTHLNHTMTNGSDNEQDEIEQEEIIDDDENEGSFLLIRIKSQSISINVY